MGFSGDKSNTSRVPSSFKSAGFTDFGLNSLSYRLTNSNKSDILYLADVSFVEPPLRDFSKVRPPTLSAILLYNTFILKSKFATQCDSITKKFYLKSIDFHVYL